MPISCTPQDLVTGANCFYCQSPNLDAIEIYALCIMAGGFTPPDCIYLTTETGDPIYKEDGSFICLEQPGPWPTPVPFAYFKLNDSAPANALINGVDGDNMIIQGANGVSVAGIIGNALQLGSDPANDWWVSATNAHWPMAGSFTVRLWIKPRYHFIAGNDLLIGDGTQWRVDLLSDTFGAGNLFMHLALLTTGADVSLYLTNPLLLNQWNHVMFWFEQGVGASCSLNNGTEIFTPNVNPIDPVGGTAALALKHSFSGVNVDIVDEIAIWDRVLTPAQRTADYNGGNGVTYP